MKKFILVLVGLVGLISGAFAKEITVVTRGEEYTVDVMWAHPNTTDNNAVFDRADTIMSIEIINFLEELDNTMGNKWYYTTEERQTMIKGCKKIIGDCAVVIPLSDDDKAINGAIMTKIGARNNPNLGAVVTLEYPDVIYTDEVILVIRGEACCAYYIDYDKMADMLIDINK